jgi:hypothetical protein
LNSDFHLETMPRESFLVFRIWSLSIQICVWSLFIQIWVLTWLNTGLWEATWFLCLESRAKSIYTNENFIRGGITGGNGQASRLVTWSGDSSRDQVIRHVTRWSDGYTGFPPLLLVVPGRAWFGDNGQMSYDRPIGHPTPLAKRKRARSLLNRKIIRFGEN